MADYTNMTIDSMEAEIRGLKSLLNESDHTIIQMLEGLVDCTSATGIISFFKSISDEVKGTISKRQEWRQSIQYLETEIAKRTEDGDTEEADAE